MKTLPLVKIFPLHLAVIILLFFSSHKHSYSQGKEANNWYFGMEAGITFNQGSPPVALTDGQMECHLWSEGSTTMSDGEGNLLFYGNGETIWNRNHQIMENGQDVGFPVTQGALSIPHPGSDHLYYYFNFFFDNQEWHYELQYSVIDMNLDNGLGAVVPGKKGITLMEGMSTQLNAVRNFSTDSIWLVTHGYNTTYYYAFLITPDSIHTQPVESPAGSVIHDVVGYLKISPDGSKLVITALAGPDQLFELLDFDVHTGKVSDEFLVKSDKTAKSAEFSPDNTKLYVMSHHLWQYDLEAGSPQEILESEVQITEDPDLQAALQLAPDGKIYSTYGDWHYLSVINSPNWKGTLCNFQVNAISLGGKRNTENLPTFIQSYMNDPIILSSDQCVGSPTYFSIKVTDGIDSVYWKFNDQQNSPYDTSTLFNPAYTFSHPDTFYVDLTAYSGYLERKVTEEIIIYPLPEPDLGADTVLCDENFSITLNPNCEADFYTWSTGQFNVEEITISDTGTYWVRVRKNGCIGTDSIDVSLYPALNVDSSNLHIKPASCGYTNGAISGLEIEGVEPLHFYWLNNNDTVGTAADLLNVPAGIYALYVEDGNKCIRFIDEFYVRDEGSLRIDSIEHQPDHCTQQVAFIQIHHPEYGNEEIWYSINDGIDYYQNNGLFQNLTAGTYHIVIKDEEECTGFYEDNPVVIVDVSAPEVLSVTAVPENDFQENGQIILEAFTEHGSVFYSIDDGNTYQQNNGLFTGLSAGTYDCRIRDEYHCDTAFQVIVERLYTLQAIASDDTSCLGSLAMSPVKVNHFFDVKSFHIELSYDTSMVQCQAYSNTHPQLEEGFTAGIIPDQGKIVMNWEGTQAVSLPENAVITELVFHSVNAGNTILSWSEEQDENYFLDEEETEINVNYYEGEISTYIPPEIYFAEDYEFCEGDTFQIVPQIAGGNGLQIASWLGPDGTGYSGRNLLIEGITEIQSGMYQLEVTDSMGCTDQKDFMIYVYPAPGIAFADKDTLYAAPGYELSAGAGYASYLWNTGAESESIVIDTSGLYGVEVTSMEGCTAKDQVLVLWKDAALHLPNAFSPDNDGLNDEFKPVGLPDYYSRFEMRIYNRWGTEIFYTNDFGAGWDGTYKGEKVSPGAYVYVIRYTGNHRNAETKELKGTVILVR